MAVFRSTKEEVQKYFESEAISQSQLKLLLVSGEAFLNVKEPKLFFEEKVHFILGSALDDWITMGDDFFKANYYVSELEDKPSSTIKSIIQRYYDLTKELDFENLSETQADSYLLDAIEEHEYQAKWKNETRIKKIKDEGNEYFLELKASEGKTILSIEEYAKILEMKDVLLNHDYTSRYFNIANNKFADIDCFYQLPIYHNINISNKKIPCKALLDMVHVLHDEKIIIPFDIKTIGDYTKHFDKQSKKRRYDIQASWYTRALEAWRDMHYPGYEIDSFRFIVISTTHECEPLIFETNQFFLDAGQHGTYSMLQGGTNNNFTKSTYIKTEGWETLLYQYVWHMENGFDKDWKNVYNKGVYVLSGNYQKQGKNEIAVR